MILSNKNYQKELLQKGFYQNRDKNGDDFNYDINSLIESFDFYEFVDYAERFKEDIKDYGAFIVITTKQYIIGYNASFGAGTHLSSFARVMKDIKGGGKIIDYEDAKILSNECIKKYITGRIMYERSESYGRPKCEGYISFNIVDKIITEEELEVLQMFNEDYSLEIKRIINKYGINKFKIIITYRNEEGILDNITTNDLNDLYEILKKNISNNKFIDDENEVIIGTQYKNKTLIKEL